MGYNVSGIEPSFERRMMAERVCNVAIHDINLLESTPDIGAFNIITLFFVLEHLSEPIRFCSILRRYLIDEGCLIVEVPNLDDLMLEACPQYRSFWWQRAHISYFSTNTLRRVLVEAGFANVELVGVQRYGIENMMNWLITGKPQIQSPSFETTGPYQQFEQKYKTHLENTMRYDTLVAVASGNKLFNTR